MFGDVTFSLYPTHNNVFRINYEDYEVCTKVWYSDNTNYLIIATHLVTISNFSHLGNPKFGYTTIMIFWECHDQYSGIFDM
jgi:hypothetical protein